MDPKPSIKCQLMGCSTLQQKRMNQIKTAQQPVPNTNSEVHNHSTTLAASPSSWSKYLLGLELASSYLVNAWS
jgi:hypothetical protein